MSGTRAIFLGLSAYALASRKGFSFIGGILILGILVTLPPGQAPRSSSCQPLSDPLSAMLTVLMSKVIL